MRTTKRRCLLTLITCALLACLAQPALTLPLHQDKLFTTDFRLDECTFSSTGSNAFFILEPGFEATFEGEEDGEFVELTITVLDKTRMVDGIETRIVKEVEMHDGEIVEISRNFFAICIETNSVFYFGEEVDIFEEGVIVSHEGSWLAFKDDAQPGLIMPGIILLGSRYQQEVAPDVAEDRAIIVAMNKTVKTPAGTFEDCIKTLETTPLDPGAREIKFYAPGIGLIKDGVLELTDVVFP